MKKEIFERLNNLIQQGHDIDGPTYNPRHQEFWAVMWTKDKKHIWAFGSTQEAVVDDLEFQLSKISK